MRNEKGKKYGRPREDAQPRTPDEGVVFGRNAVKELIESGRDIEKIFEKYSDKLKVSFKNKQFLEKI